MIKEFAAHCGFGIGKMFCPEDLTEACAINSNHARIAVHPSANAIVTAATLNAVRIAAGPHSAVRTSRPIIRDDRYGLASGRARKIANGWTSSSTAIQIFPI